VLPLTCLLYVFLHRATPLLRDCSVVVSHAGRHCLLHILFPAVTRDARAKLLGQKGATVWLSGLSGSGKSTVSVELEQQLFAKKVLSYRLDGDNIRQGLNKNLSFSPADRKENIRRISEVAKLMCDIGVVVTTAFISPYTEDRDMAREIHKAASIPFIEVFVDCPLEVAESRDPKGLYKKARSGEIKNFTGIDAPYEKPPSPEITLDTSKQTIAECAGVILTYLTEKGLISSDPKEEAKPAKDLEVAPAAPAAEAEAEKVPAAV